MKLNTVERKRFRIRKKLKDVSKDRYRLSVGVEIVVVEGEPYEVKVREGGRDLPSEVVPVEVENGEGGKCSELSRERAFEAIMANPNILEEGESAYLRGQVAANLIALKAQVGKAIERPYLRRYGAR